MANVEYSNVAKNFGSVAVIHDLSLLIANREFTVLLGPSGCGKTTLLRMTAGLESVTRGNILIDGERINDIHPRDRNIAMVFQNYALYPTMKVFDNIAFSLQVKKTPADLIKKKVEEAAAILNITDYLGRYPKELSGGQRQRVAMGRAMVRDAKVFLFDEPLSNLDAKLRAHMRLEIRQLHDRLHTTTIYVTHDQIEAMTMADKIVLMKAGEIEQVGTPDALYDRPASRYAADFIGSPSMNFLEAEIVVEEGRPVLRAAGVKLLLSAERNGLAAGKVTCGVRPPDMELDDAGAFEGKLVLAERTGADQNLHLAIGGENLVATVPRHAPVRQGAVTRLFVPQEKIHLFDRETGRRL